MLSELSPPVLYELGLEAAVEWLAEQFEARHGIGCRVVDDGEPKPLAEEVRVLVFQAVRELLANAGKHADAKLVRVTLAKRGDRLAVTVEDDGRGFEPKILRRHSTTEGGFGLFNVRERLALLDGEIEIDSGPGRGTRTLLQVPLLTGSTDSSP